jgi:hypothetical protein
VDRKVIEIGGRQYIELPKGRKRRRTIYPSTTPAGYPLASALAAHLDEARAEQSAGTNAEGLVFPRPVAGTDGRPTLPAVSWPCLPPRNPRPRPNRHRMIPKGVEGVREVLRLWLSGQLAAEDARKAEALGNLATRRRATRVTGGHQVLPSAQVPGPSRPSETIDAGSRGWPEEEFAFAVV